MPRSTRTKGQSVPAAEPDPTATPSTGIESVSAVGAIARVENSVNAAQIALMAETTGPFATGARASEIALMDEFGLAEFTELTGVGVGDHGIYRVGPTGVSLRVSEGGADFTPIEQHKLHQAARQLTLAFPCMPAAFMTWYDATRGTPRAGPQGQPAGRGVSDFPLAKGFAEELEAGGGAAIAMKKGSAPSSRIIAAFRVKPDLAENKKWWDNRMRHAARYKLEVARASTGRAGTASQWDPLQIAVWLVDREHLPSEKVRLAVEEHFPKIDSSLL